MSDRPPKQQEVGFTAEQRAAIRAVDEEAVIDLVSEMLRKLNNTADRLEAFASSEQTRTKRGET